MTADVGVSPYWELTFDADGDPGPGEPARTAEEAGRHGITDLVLFAHDRNNDRPTADRLHDRFFRPFAELVPGLGYAGVRWPSMRFTDEPFPDAGPAAGEGGPDRGARTRHEGPALDEATARTLAECFPQHPGEVAEVVRLLAEQPRVRGAFDQFGMAVRELVALPSADDRAVLAADTQDELIPQGDPGMLFDDTTAVCRGFLEALEETGALERGPVSGRQGDYERLWHGARELLRLAVSYAVKRRAGAVGQLGLGPALAELARRSPGVRVHLVGHGSGARLVSFALRGLPADAGNVASVTLLQGAFSHYAFSANLPNEVRGKGVLHGQQEKVRGPLVCCYSRHDTALGVFYPLASRMAGDWEGLLGIGHKWGALGFDGVQGVEGTMRYTLKEALRQALPGSGCVNVDVAPVVRRGRPPVGGHHDICHEELARVVLSAGGLLPPGAG